MEVFSLLMGSSKFQDIGNYSNSRDFDSSSPEKLYAIEQKGREDVTHHPGSIFSMVNSHKILDKVKYFA